MIQKILIANRGEIASRIIRTCKKLGIETVAIYSEADQKAPFVSMADESFLIGPPRVNESYLNVEKIIQIAKEQNVDAIHPGYGFLSENSEFARVCEEADITFIGPNHNVIKQMGNKIEARNIMKQANVPIVPGTSQPVATTDEAVSIGNSIGYPIMLKAASGGGGIGMQVVQSDKELIKAFESNKKRAETFFGDGSMFLEKMIENGRHIEIQVLADHHGQAVQLYERECSIQRRNQKVIEEAPSSFITEETRNKMGEAAVQAVRALHYTNAGTIEFLVDEQENFYFLEMNTRIQVEHPVTEEITGIDIVEEQINIANGYPLSFNQESIKKSGHAIEVRIYAEDPIKFFPSPGLVTVYEEPTGDSIRIESGITNNYEVTPFYDPMIAKLIVKGPNRSETILKLKNALLDFKIEGIKTNIPMLLKVIDHEEFKLGNTTTNFVDKHYLPYVKN